MRVILQVNSHNSTNARPNSSRSILWDNPMEGLQRLKWCVSIFLAVCLFSKYLNASRSPRQQVAAPQLESGPSYIEGPSPSWLSLCFSRETIGYNNILLVYQGLNQIHVLYWTACTGQYGLQYCNKFGLMNAQYSNRRYFQLAYFIPIVGVGKRGSY